MLINCTHMNLPETKYKGYRVCDVCKIVIFSGKSSYKTKFEKDRYEKNIYDKILDYLENKQNRILEYSDIIWVLEQKRISNKDLTDEEKKEVYYLEAFREIRLNLQFCIKNGVSMQDQDFRENLYNLLHIIDDLDLILNKYDNEKNDFNAGDGKKFKNH